MYGFNVTDKTFPYDNRPVVPLVDLPFDQWWFHGHLDYPPHPGDFFELPAGKAATAEIACTKGATSYFSSAHGGDIQNGNDPCPGSPPAAIHTTGPDDLKGCALAIAYKSNVKDVQPEDFTVFSVNQTCVWDRFTDFAVPERMPACPDGGCLCAWFWIHSVSTLVVPAVLPFLNLFISPTVVLNRVSFSIGVRSPSDVLPRLYDGIQMQNIWIHIQRGRCEIPVTP